VELTETLCLIPILICFRYQDDLQASSRMDVATSVGSYLWLDDVDLQGCIRYVIGKLSCNLIVRTHLLYKIFIRSFFFIVVKFNVSSTKDNARARLSRYV
jgi:hypothetical protein